MSQNEIRHRHVLPPPLRDPRFPRRDVLLGAHIQKILREIPGQPNFHDAVSKLRTGYLPPECGQLFGHYRSFFVAYYVHLLCSGHDRDVIRSSAIALCAFFNPEGHGKKQVGIDLCAEAEALFLKESSDGADSNDVDGFHEKLSALSIERDRRVAAVENDSNLDADTKERMSELIDGRFNEKYLELAGEEF